MLIIIGLGIAFFVIVGAIFVLSLCKAAGKKTPRP